MIFRDIDHSLRRHDSVNCLVREMTNDSMTLDKAALGPNFQRHFDGLFGSVPICVFVLRTLEKIVQILKCDKENPFLETN